MAIVTFVLVMLGHGHRHEQFHQILLWQLFGEVSFPNLVRHIVKKVSLLVMMLKLIPVPVSALVQ